MTFRAWYSLCEFRVQFDGTFGANRLLAIIAYELGRSQQSERLAAKSGIVIQRTRN